MKRIIKFLIIILLTSCSSVGQFGAGVDITFDPRTIGMQIDDTIMQKNLNARLALSEKKYFLKVSELMKNTKYPEMYDTLEKIMLERKNIHPNVDYPCGPTYHLMGIDTDFFTPVFVMARITGWSAHIMEQHTANKLIRPLSKYKGSEHREVLALNIR